MKKTRAIFTSGILGTLAWASTANAFYGHCFLKVDGQTYLEGVCNIELFHEGRGGFSIGIDDPKARYFASVLRDENGVAQGYWNGVEAESQAHAELGTLTRNGNCWENSKAMVCARRL